MIGGAYVVPVSMTLREIHSEGIYKVEYFHGSRFVI